MNLPEISIRNPVMAWMLMAAVLVFGFICYHRLGISQYPDVDFPVVNINVTLEGAAPEVVEKDILDTIEDVVLSIQGIKSVSSSARNGSANISIEFQLNKNIDVAVQEVQTAIARVQKRLPEETDPPVVTKANPEDRPILWLTVSSEKYSTKELMAFVRDRIKDRFTTVDGVSEVFLGGYLAPVLRVDLSLAALNRYQLTVDDVVTAIQTEHVELPAGRIETSESEKSLRVMGEAKTPEEFGRLLIKRRGGSPNFIPIQLNQVAKVTEGLEDIRRKSRVMGKSAVGLGIRKQRGSNAVEVAHLVKARLQEIVPQLPDGVELAVRSDSTTFIEESVHELVFTLALAALLTGTVCWLFLGSWTATLNVLMAIPVSIVGTFIILSVFGFTLNTFTLLALTLAIGIVVDDAIIVLENITRYQEMGHSSRRAALLGSKEIMFAIIATSSAIIAVFLPVAFMAGVIGRFFYQFAICLSAAVALSCLESLTLAPMRCSQLLNQTHSKRFLFVWIDRQIQRLTDVYASCLGLALRYRWVVVLSGVAIFLSSLALSRLINKEFTPNVDQSQLFVRVKTPEGSSLDFTDVKTLELEKIFARVPEIESFFVAIGGFGGGQVNSANIFLSLRAKNERPIDPELKRRRTQDEVAQALRQEFKQVKEVQAFIQGGSNALLGGGRGFPIEFTVRGPDYAELIQQANEIQRIMNESGLFLDVNSDDIQPVPEIQISPDRLKALQRGVEIEAISRTMQVLFGSARAGSYSLSGQRSDIRVQLQNKERDKVSTLDRVMIRNNRGELIALRDVVQVNERKSPQAVYHEDRIRSVRINANNAPGASQQQALAFIEDTAEKTLSKGYYIVLAGNSQTFRESFQSLLFVMGLGLLVAYMILASQFNSFIDPVSVLMALPFSLTGALIFLYLTGQTINIYSVIGIILLLGIVKKNSILLVEFTNQLRAEGVSTMQALMRACPLRLRPILMTSLATIVAAIPPALSFGPGAETSRPMAVTVIGGVLLSTVFTLFVVPCFYSLTTSDKRVFHHGANEDEDLQAPHQPSASKALHQ